MQKESQAAQQAATRTNTGEHLLALVVFLVLGVTACATARSGAGLIPDKDGHAEAWNRSDLPVRVVVAADLPESWTRQVRAAVETVNSVCHLLTWGGVGAEEATYQELWGYPPHGVILVVSDGGTDSSKALTWVYRNGGYLYSALTILPESAADLYFAPQMALHEILHGLGVAHERDPRSVMWWVSTADSTKFKTATKALLRNTYCTPKASP